MDMDFRKRITTRDRPERIARLSLEYRGLVERALRIASRRAGRSSVTIRGLLKSARVGDSTKEGFKSSTITFSYPPYHRGVRMSIGWHALARSTSPATLATSIAGALRDRLAYIDWERRKAREHGGQGHS